MDSQIHLILQPHSDIGKSYIAFLLKQYFELENNFKYYSIQDKDILFWDEIFEDFFSQNQQVFIIKINSAFYETFKKYIDETNVLNSILTLNSLIFNHYIFTPGRNGTKLYETLNFIKTNTNKRIGEGVIWENYNLGTTLKEYTKGQFSCLSEFPDFKNTQLNINKSIILPEETFYSKKDLSSCILSGQTFDQVICDSNNNLIYRQRLYQIKKRTFEAIKNAGI